FKYIPIIINRLIKIQYYISVKILITNKFIKYFINKVFTFYKLLNTIISDRGFSFIL
ncbi:hypothetical protein NEUTE2DRAFT_62103, partial [Neurospora tetrasperma FGSC 2509]